MKKNIIKLFDFISRVYSFVTFIQSLLARCFSIANCPFSLSLLLHLIRINQETPAKLTIKLYLSSLFIFLLLQCCFGGCCSLPFWSLFPTSFPPCFLVKGFPRAFIAIPRCMLLVRNHMHYVTSSGLCVIDGVLNMSQHFFDDSLST